MFIINARWERGERGEDVFGGCTMSSGWQGEGVTDRVAKVIGNSQDQNSRLIRAAIFKFLVKT